MVDMIYWVSTREFCANRIGLKFGLSLNLYLHFVHAGSEGSVYSVRIAYFADSLREYDK